MVDREQYKYIDGLPNSHKLTIGGLRMNTLYLFSVMSYNELGQSSYLPDLARAETKGKSPARHSNWPRVEHSVSDADIDLCESAIWLLWPLEHGFDSAESEESYHRMGN